MARVAIVSGSNRGLGFAMVKLLCEQNPSWIVYLTARDASKGAAAVEQLRLMGLNPKFHQLDVTNEESIGNLRAFLLSEHGGLDVLINNAGIAYKVASTAPFSEQAEVTAGTNYFGQMKMCRILFPILRDHARVVTISSTDGHATLAKCSPDVQKAFKECRSVDDVDRMMKCFIALTKEGKHVTSGWVQSAYGTAHIALTTATRILQCLLDEDQTRSDRVVNSCCPGAVKTEMSGHKGDKTPEEGAETPLYLATLPENVVEPRDFNCIFEMGCCFGTNAEPDQPSPETRRRIVLEATEKRMAEQRAKGMQDPSALDRATKKQAEMDRLERERVLAGPQGGEGLKWTVG